MKSKIILLVLAVFVVSTTLLGCGKTTDQSIPFLTLVPDNANGESIKKAILNFWDLKNGKIIQTDKVIYTVTQTTDMKSEQAFYEDHNGDRPLYWDGKDCIILPWFFKSVTNLYKRTELLELPAELKGFQFGSRVILGKDVEMVRIPTGDNHNYKYTVKLWDGEKYIEKELNLNYEFQDTNSQPSYPVAIDNDGTNLNILVSGGYNPQTGMDLFLCTVDKKDWTSKWYKISVEEDAGIGPSKPPNYSNSIYFNGSFYLPSGCCSVAKVGVEERICKKWKKITASKRSEEDIAYGTSILGSFNDMIIVQFTVLRGIGTKRYISVFKNEENVGMMYLVNGNVDVMDKDGNVLSNTTLNENSSIIFPKMTGGM
jgi:hypothetical protein